MFHHPWFYVAAGMEARASGVLGKHSASRTTLFVFMTFTHFNSYLLVAVLSVGNGEENG